VIAPGRVALLPAPAGGGGGSPQTVTAQVATLTLTGLAGTKTAGAVTLMAQVGALTLTPVAGTKTGGPVTLTAQVAALALTAVAGAVSAGGLPPQTVTAQVAALTLTGLSGPWLWGPLLFNDPANNFTDTPWTTAGSVSVAGSGGQTGSGFNLPVGAGNSIYYSVPAASQTDTVTVGFHIKFSAVSLGTFAAGSWDFAQFALAGNLTQASLTINPAGILELYAWTGVTVASAAGRLVADTWYFIEAQVKTNDTAGVLELRVDGLLVGRRTGIDTHPFGSPLTFDRFTITTMGATPGSLAVDNIYLRNDATFMGLTTGVLGQVGNLTLTAVPGTVTAGSVTKAAQVATLTLTGVNGAPTGSSPQTITAQVATLTLTGQPGTRASGGAAVAAQVAPLALSGVQGVLTPGPATKTAQVGLLALTGVPGIRTSGTTKDAQVATLTLTARSGTVAGGPTVQAAQVGLLTLTALPGRLTLPFAVSAHSFVATDRSQRVEIRVNNCDGVWAVFVRAPAEVNVERPGYYVTNTPAGVTWYRAGALVASVVLPAFTTAGGTIELECIDDLCTLRVRGVEVARHDFSDAPLTTDDDHQGFASYGGAALVITDAEGGGLPELPVDDDVPSPSRALIVVTNGQARQALVTAGVQDRRPL
jgi:hypothetical protein